MLCYTMRKDTFILQCITGRKWFDSSMTRIFRIQKGNWLVEPDLEDITQIPFHFYFIFMSIFLVLISNEKEKHVIQIANKENIYRHFHCIFFSFLSKYQFFLYCHLFSIQWSEGNRFHSFFLFFFVCTFAVATWINKRTLHSNPSKHFFTTKKFGLYFIVFFLFYLYFIVCLNRNLSYRIMRIWINFFFIEILFYSWTA